MIFVGQLLQMANREQKDKKQLIKKLKDKYRLVIINDNTFDERFSAYLTPLNVIAGIAVVFSLIALIVVGFLVFTPLREYIPGYSDTQTKLNALNASIKADSLEEAQRIYKQYFTNLSNILTGEIDSEMDSTKSTSERRVYEGLDFSASREDSLLREEIESQERYAVAQDVPTNEKVLGLPALLFFAPVKGQVTSEFDRSIQHYGVDITANEGEAIKAVYDGVVIFASYTYDGGYVIQIQHPDNLISVYKHNSVLLKKVGDQVSAGESVAVIGNTGQLTDGPHLHFELWHKGNAINPLNFISFTP